jgi:hypothetical protein
MNNNKEVGNADWVFWAELTDKFVQKRGVDQLAQDKTRQDKVMVAPGCGWLGAGADEGAQLISMPSTR